MTPILPELVDITEIAAKYGLSLIGLKRRARAKGFTHIKIGKKRLLSPEHVKELLKGATISAAAGTRSNELTAQGERVTRARRHRSQA